MGHLSLRCESPNLSSGDRACLTLFSQQMNDVKDVENPDQMQLEVNAIVRMAVSFKPAKGSAIRRDVSRIQGTLNAVPGSTPTEVAPAPVSVKRHRRAKSSGAALMINAPSSHQEPNITRNRGIPVLNLDEFDARRAADDAPSSTQSNNCKP